MKVIVIGGGPSGIMAALTASTKNEVTLLEKNDKLGKKLYITGKGRCNITNNRDIGDFFDYIKSNSEFLYSSLYTFTNEDTIRYFEDKGVKLKVERGQRVFPESDKSSDIISAFNQDLVKHNVKVMLNSEVKKLYIKDGKISYAELLNGEKIYGDHFIISTGGKSYPQTGSSGDGYKFSKELGHSVTKIKPYLVPIELKEEYIKDLMGLSLKNVELKIIVNGKVVHSEFGEMLFTHFGISGPIVLSSSNYAINGSIISIDLKPALSEEELDKRIQNDFKKYINKNFKNSLDDLLPKKMIGTIIMLSGIDENKKINSITKEERKNLVNLIKNLKFNFKSLRPIEEAIVTSGGVKVTEIDPNTMMSKIVKNLSFAGEVIDVDAETGGYNIQIALSTGYLAGVSI